MQAFEDITKFVILFPSRCGSSWLFSNLNSHEKILSLSEIFNPKFVDRYEYRREMRHRNTRKRLWIEYQRGCRISKKNPDVFGFKLAYNQLGFATDILNIIEKDQYKIIHMYRENVLDWIVSFQLAFRTRVWCRKKDEEEQTKYDTEKIKIRYKKSLREIKRLQKQIKSFRRRFSKKCDYMEVTYEKLFSDEQDAILKEIQLWLGVEPQNLQTNLVKQNRRKPEDIIINYHEFEKIKDLKF